MGHAARRNPTAQHASAGKLLSRQTILGAMDHALERHADALRILEARIAGLKERIAKLESVLKVEPPAPHIDLTGRVVTAKMEVSPAASGSAQPCGCDPGANWTCETHRVETIGYVSAD